MFMRIVHEYADTKNRLAAFLKFFWKTPNT